MNRRRLAVLSLLGLTLAACAEREDDFTRVIPPPSPELRQRAEAGDAAAQFALADHCWARQSARKVL